MEYHQIHCLFCGCKLRVPKNLGKLHITCPNCKKKFDFDSAGNPNSIFDQVFPKNGEQNTSATDRTKRHSWTLYVGTIFLIFACIGLLACIEKGFETNDLYFIAACGIIGIVFLFLPRRSKPAKSAKIHQTIPRNDTNSKNQPRHPNYSAHTDTPYSAQDDTTEIVGKCTACGADVTNYASSKWFAYNVTKKRQIEVFCCSDCLSAWKTRKMIVMLIFILIGIPLAFFTEFIGAILLPYSLRFVFGRLMRFFDKNGDGFIQLIAGVFTLLLGVTIIYPICMLVQEIKEYIRISRILNNP